MLGGGFFEGNLETKEVIVLLQNLKKCVNEITSSQGNTQHLLLWILVF